MGVSMNSACTAAESAVFVHPSAICESQRVGEGTRVWPFAHVMDGAVVGRNCNIGEHAYIERGARMGEDVTVKNHVMVWEGVTIEDHVFVGPGAIFTNDLYPRSRNLPEAANRYRHPENWLVSTTVRHGASIGAGAIIRCGVTLGRYAVVAAGAVVTRDVADHRVVMGNPAGITGWACRCGRPLPKNLTCSECARRYKLERDNLVVAE